MSPSSHSRVCPTRIDAAPALFSHRLTAEQCQSRQRGQYHKCFTCVFSNAVQAARSLGVRGRSRPELAPVRDEPVRKLPKSTARAV